MGSMNRRSITKSRLFMLFVRRHPASFPCSVSHQTAEFKSFSVPCPISSLLSTQLVILDVDRLTLIGSEKDDVGLWTPRDSVVRRGRHLTMAMSQARRGRQRGREEQEKRRRIGESTFGRTESDCRGRVFVAPFHNITSFHLNYGVLCCAVGHYAAFLPLLSALLLPLCSLPS